MQLYAQVTLLPQLTVVYKPISQQDMLQQHPPLKQSVLWEMTDLQPAPQPIPYNVWFNMLDMYGPILTHINNNPGLVRNRLS